MSNTTRLTVPQDHERGCPYLEWYNTNAHNQPLNPLAMVETLCNCNKVHWVQADLSQIKGTVKQLNEYRAMLEKCEYVFNILTRQGLPEKAGYKDTYQLVAAIEKLLKKDTT